MIETGDSKLVGIHGWTDGHVLVTYEGIVHVITPLDQIDLLEKNAGNSKLTYWKIIRTVSYMLNIFFGIMMLWMFSNILVNGYLRAVEPNRVIALVEWYMSVGLIVFGLYCLYKRPKSQFSDTPPSKLTYWKKVNS